MKIRETIIEDGSSRVFDVYSIECRMPEGTMYLIHDSDEEYCLSYSYKNERVKIDIVDTTLENFECFIMQDVEVDSFPVMAHQIIANNQYLYHMLIDNSMWEFATDEDRESVPQHMLKKDYNPLYDFLEQLKQHP